MLILETDNLSKTYRAKNKTVKALDGVSLQLAAGDLMVVHGPSGSGKSTLLFCCGAMLSPDSGDVILNGQNIYGLSAKERAQCRARNIGFVFQRFHLIPYLTVIENVMVAATSPDSSKIRSEAERLLEKYGMADRAQHLPGELSVGERQRTALARAMLNQPALILADEPTGNLDAENSDIVTNSLREYAAAGHAVMMVTHDTRALQAGNRTLLLKNGKLANG